MGESEIVYYQHNVLNFPYNLLSSNFYFLNYSVYFNYKNYTHHTNNFSSFKRVT